MGILNYIDANNGGRFRCYGTRKFSLDEHIVDTIASENSDTDVIPLDSSGRIAESDQSRVKVVRIPNYMIENSAAAPLFSYFLDGSRRTFKVDDIAIGNKILPIIAGQIVIGCCNRQSREKFKSAKLRHENIISLPAQFNSKHLKPSDFSRDYCEKLNEYLKNNNRFAASHNIKISNILFYKTDGSAIKDPTDRNRLRNSAIAQIQNRMTDLEQLLVSELCKEKRLNDENWLIKDGSIEYNPNFTPEQKKHNQNQWVNKMRENYQHVVGVSKSFDPELIKDYEKQKMAQTIAELKPFERTKAYKYPSKHSSGMTFAVWYLRLRKEENFRETRFSDVIKCELIMFNPTELVSTGLINTISANLIREAYPVCFGNDSRWGNHLYPVYLTETFCKSHYIDGNVFLNLF